MSVATAATEVRPGEDSSVPPAQVAADLSVVHPSVADPSEAVAAATEPSLPVEDSVQVSLTEPTVETVTGQPGAAT
ncbi:hypothetical protein, partial [Acinetobacter baumannii]|uniref:hypothetical protein n=1 Tax=Acinetobacter baumannii TaxID=470 RepID=UPI001C0A15D2